MIKFIGCGSAKCGSTSLSILLGDCKNIIVKHERDLKRKRLPYVYDREEIDRAIKRFKEYGNYGEVGFYYLPYIPNFIASFPDIRIICLKRDVDKTVQSYMKNMGDTHPWVYDIKGKYLPDLRFGHCFPKYGTCEKWTITASFYRFWNDYYHRARAYEKVFPNNFKIFSINALNSRKGQQSIFDFIGIPEEDRVYKKECKYNVGSKA
jgi:hypothetical protein